MEGGGVGERRHSSHTPTTHTSEGKEPHGGLGGGGTFGIEYKIEVFEYATLMFHC